VAADAEWGARLAAKAKEVEVAQAALTETKEKGELVNPCASGASSLTFLMCGCIWVCPIPGSSACICLLSPGLPAC
jgi:hypothetical protein